MRANPNLENSKGVVLLVFTHDLVAILVHFHINES
jgi:hypothetical protein